VGKHTTLQWHRINTWPVAALTACSEARYRLRITTSAYPTCIRHPRYGVYCRNIAMPFSTKKIEWLGYPMVKKFWRYVYSFWQNVGTWQTHRQTDTARWLRPCLH